MHVEYSSSLWKELENKEYRQGYVDAQYSVEMPFQINSLRKARGWTQAELADRAGLSRSYISKIEQPGYGPASLKTLKKLCGAFDVALHLTFISFSELVQKSVAFNIETFYVDSFIEDSLYEESLSPPSQHSLNWEGVVEVQEVDFSPFLTKKFFLDFFKNTETHKYTKIHLVKWPFWWSAKYFPWDVLEGRKIVSPHNRQNSDSPSPHCGQRRGHISTTSLPTKESAWHNLHPHPNL